MDEVIKLISEGTLREAIDKLLDFFQSNNYSEELRDTLLIKNEFNRLEEEKIKNTINFDAYNNNINSIIDRVLNLNSRINNTIDSKVYAIGGLIDSVSSIEFLSNKFKKISNSQLVVAKGMDFTVPEIDFLVYFASSNNSLNDILENDHIKIRKVAVILIDGGEINIKNNSDLITFSLSDYKSGSILFTHINDFFEGIVPLYSMYDKRSNVQSKKAIPYGYKANIPAIIHLLIGEALYKDRLVFIRELMQNSYDAYIRKDGNDHNFELIIRYDSEGYIDFIDYGCGMTLDDIRGSFSTIGRNYGRERNKNGLVEHNKDSIGRFGIGFISVFMVSDKIEIVTKAEGCSPVNFLISDVSEPFRVIENSNVQRGNSKTGTTIRVYLLSDFKFETLFLKIQHFLRFFKNVSVYNNNSLVRFDSFKNKYTDHRFVEYSNRVFNSKLKLGFNASNLENIVFTNNGFYIGNDLQNLLVDDFKFLTGFIDFRSKAIDLSIDRNSVLNTDKLLFYYDYVAEIIVDLLRKYATRNRVFYSKNISPITDIWVFRKKVLEMDRDLFDIVIPIYKIVISLFDLFGKKLKSHSLNKILLAFRDIDEIEEVILDVTVIKMNGSYTTLREIIQRSKYIDNGRVLHTDYDTTFKDGEEVEFDDSKNLIDLGDTEYGPRISVLSPERNQFESTSVDIVKVLRKILFHRGVNLLKYIGVNDQEG